LKEFLGALCVCCGGFSLSRIPLGLNIISKEGALVTAGALVRIRLQTLGTIATSEQTSRKAGAK